MTRRLLALCCLLLLLPACDEVSVGGGGLTSSASTPGSGVMVSETRQVSGFDSIDLQAAASVAVTQGSPQSVWITADDNLIDLIGTRVSAGKLIVDSRSPYDSPRGVEIVITVPEVRQLELSGAGSITGSNVGSTGTIRALHSGAGSISLHGTAAAFTGKLAGVGTIDAQGLLSGRSEIVISGTGDCRTTAIEELDVTISGYGDVYYAGSPSTVSSKITGTGKLIPL